MGLFGRFKKVKLEDTSDIVEGLMQDFKATVSSDDSSTMWVGVPSSQEIPINVNLIHRIEAVGDSRGSD